MNNPIKGNRANPSEPVNVRRFAVSRYKVLINEAVEMQKQDKKRWEVLFSMNKWQPQDGTTQTKKP
jgi:hypothetical protein